MVKELAPQSPEGEYLRPKSQLRAQESGLWLYAKKWGWVGMGWD